ncbi:MAG: helical backbone metal receptor, partial [Anaerolineales bacterium]|nr:helical backbone metal receptor [Anaerolineales bacterium]
MIHKFVILLTILGLVLTACSPTTTPTPAPEVEPIEEIEPTQAPAVDEPQVEPESQMLVFSDDSGRMIELPDYAQRIVTLGPSSLESLFAIGAGAQVVGREEFSTYPEEALEVTSVGSLWGEIPTEAILALEPDLVIAPEIISPEQIQTLTDLGLTVYFQANPVDFPGLWQNLRNLAALSGHEAEAEALIADLEARVNRVVEAVAPLSYKPVVFYELDATDPQNPYTIGGGTIIDAIISMAGGFNMGAVLEGQYAPISSEEVITQNPEIILLADAPYGITPETVTDRAGWDAITAVKNGQMYEFDPFLVSVPGPRLVYGLEAMTQIIHPGILASDRPVSFKDDLGRQIELVVPAQRIVTLGPSSLESLFAI